jgi:hypothetical protein
MTSLPVTGFTVIFTDKMTSLPVTGFTVIFTDKMTSLPVTGLVIFTDKITSLPVTGFTVIFNEAGYEKHRGTQQGAENSQMYNEMAIIKLVEVNILYSYCCIY